MEQYEYICLTLNVTKEEIIEQYNPIAIEKNGHIYDDIRKGMYDLPQKGKTANDLLTKNLTPNGYYQCRNTPRLWRHKWRPVTFSLLVDDFGIKYFGKQYEEYLIACTKIIIILYQWTILGGLYCGVTLD